ncbi:bifunctional aspartate transaminase/aspartate 4-decarboxylase [Sulfurovum sp. NBC37-1]|uniref:bifunctional aspartate transaminase/aspartate 4-decarboxylase n=1 Tax=Sulfurovum sp. (strain NBC37-1) TaxID=387093 RepID=UPI00015875B6|nr:bifunctional aspartate transaminase/aspartate 4-decarboxylase [Sulfurovum sp. NBC37-1]BAF71835.1 aspartate decarboxylase AsdA [Sulfurovum sp. NBC37-1]
MSQKIHPFIKEIAKATKEGVVTRRDFFQYAAAFGMSIFTAGSLIGLSASEISADTHIDWKDLALESPFEVKNILIQKAETDCSKSGCSIVNAGRGNPNFLNTLVRKSLALLTLFAADMAEKNSKIIDVGYRQSKEGMYNALKKFLAKHKYDTEADFLGRSIEYAKNETEMDADELVYELMDGVQGDFYPDPPRIFPATEKIVRKYLDRVVFSNKPPQGDFHLFVTEGATAAMIYIFNSLRENMVLLPGDKVAIVTPIFSPYLELPVLKDYGLESVYIRGDEKMGWQIPDSEVSKLKDRKVKALYMVNPTNPTSVSLNADTVKRMADTIRMHNKDMIIISDTVYASFVDEFNTFGKELPENILGVYSYSKYFGVTGWRLGVVMVHKNNVVDRLIKKLPRSKQARLDFRYRLVSTKPNEIPFYERLEIDSRQVALAHTGGLSGPQQVAMSLFSLYELIDENYSYKKSIMGILKKRWSALFEALDMPEPEGNNLTRYYALIDLKKMAEKKHGSAFAEHLVKTHPLEFLFRLAEDHHTVCLPGGGFAGPRWSLRVALANIDEEDCRQIGHAIVSVMDGYKKSMPV